MTPLSIDKLGHFLPLISILPKLLARKKRLVPVTFTVDLYNLDQIKGHFSKTNYPGFMLIPNWILWTLLICRGHWVWLYSEINYKSESGFVAIQIEYSLYRSYFQIRILLLARGKYYKLIMYTLVSAICHYTSYILLTSRYLHHRIV